MTDATSRSAALASHRAFADGHYREASFHGQDLAGADFSRADARAADFTDSSLAGAMFQEADLRGADLSRANLSGADLGQARVGLQTPAKIVLFGVALLIAVAAGVVVGLVAEWMRERTFGGSWYELAQGLGAAGILIVFLTILAARGIRDAIRVFLVILVVMVLAGVLIGGIAGAYRLETAIQLVAMILLVVAAVVAGLLGRVVAGTFGGAAILLVALGAGIITGGAGGGLGAILVSVLIVIAAKRGLANPAEDRPIHRLAYRIARLRGTRFAGADLRGATLPEGGLRNCYMTGALMDAPQSETPPSLSLDEGGS